MEWEAIEMCLEDKITPFSEIEPKDINDPPSLRQKHQSASSGYHTRCESRMSEVEPQVQEPQMEHQMEQAEDQIDPASLSP